MDSTFKSMLEPGVWLGARCVLQIAGLCLYDGQSSAKRHLSLASGLGWTPGSRVSTEQCPGPAPENGPPLSASSATGRGRSFLRGGVARSCRPSPGPATRLVMHRAGCLITGGGNQICQQGPHQNLRKKWQLVPIFVATTGSGTERC